MRDLKIPFALQGKAVVSANGAKGQYFNCIECGQRLILKQGAIRVKHFAHVADTDCKGGESQMHLSCKEFMAQNYLEVKIPCHCGICDREFEIRPTGRGQTEARIGRYVVDVLFPNDLVVEVLHTHKLEDSKWHSLTFEHKKQVFEILATDIAELIFVPAKHNFKCDGCRHSVCSLCSQIYERYSALQQYCPGCKRKCQDCNATFYSKENMLCCGSCKEWREKFRVIFSCSICEKEMQTLHEIPVGISRITHPITVIHDASMKHEPSCPPTPCWRCRRDFIPSIHPVCNRCYTPCDICLKPKLRDHFVRCRDCNIARIEMMAEIAHTDIDHFWRIGIWKRNYDVKILATIYENELRCDEEEALLFMELKNGNWELIRTSYDKKDEIKRAGFRWNPATKAWINVPECNDCDYLGSFKFLPLQFKRLKRQMELFNQIQTECRKFISKRYAEGKQTLFFCIQWRNQAEGVEKAGAIRCGNGWQNYYARGQKIDWERLSQFVGFNICKYINGLDLERSGDQ